MTCPLEHRPDVEMSTHPPDRCAGEVCAIHNRTNHLMRHFPQHWRSDRGVIERICPHGIGHPDPDDYNIVTGRDPGTHGCDGCCAIPKPAEPEPRAKRRPWVALYGPAQCGKDTIAQALAVHGFERVAFADPLREAAYGLNPIIENAYGVITYRLVELVDAYGWERAKTDYPEVRRTLQRLGTDAIRALDPTFWVDIAEKRAVDLGGPVVFTDCRFPDEAAMVRHHGGLVVRIMGDRQSNAGEHVSETSMSNYLPDLHFDNPTVKPAPGYDHHAPDEAPGKLEKQIAEIAHAIAHYSSIMVAEDVSAPAS